MIIFYFYYIILIIHFQVYFITFLYSISPSKYALQNIAKLRKKNINFEKLARI